MNIDPDDGAVTVLLRRAPGLDPDDARQYVAEAWLNLGPAASLEQVLQAAWEQAKADGYGDPLVAPQDMEDGDGHRTRWEATVSDQGSGQRAILTRIGLAGRTHRRRSVQPRALVRAVRRMLDLAGPAERIILWRRWGRLLSGREPITFRQAAKEAGVALGTAWNIEARANRDLRLLLHLEAARSGGEHDQQSWLPPEDGQCE